MLGKSQMQSVLKVLSEADEPLSAPEIARRVGSDDDRDARQAIDRLRAEGYIVLNEPRVGFWLGTEMPDDPRFKSRWQTRYKRRGC